MTFTSIISKQYGLTRLVNILALVLIIVLPRSIAAQQNYPPEDTTFFEEGFFDEYSQGEFYEEEFGGNFFDEGFFQEEEFSGESGGFYLPEEGGSSGGDELFFDEGGFDETFGTDFLEGLEPVEGGAALDLADDQAGEVELREIEQPKIKEPRVIRGYNAKVSVASPWLVGLGFDTFWYSYIDARLALDLPRKKDAGLLAPAYSFEVATFSFENFHPSGGTFQGVALQALMRMPIGPLEMSVGGGMYASGSDIRGGALFGASYTVPFIRFIVFTLESRLTYVADATPTGAAYWLDIGSSIGYPF